jgi:hypothetical protein
MLGHGRGIVDSYVLIMLLCVITAHCDIFMFSLPEPANIPTGNSHSEPSIISIAQALVSIQLCPHGCSKKCTPTSWLVGNQQNLVSEVLRDKWMTAGKVEFYSNA